MLDRHLPLVQTKGLTTCRRVAGIAAAILLCALLSSAQNQSTPTTTGNQVMGQVDFHAKTKAEKTAGVWIDGQYVGYVEELRGDKRVSLLPGEHTVSARQTGYFQVTEKIVTEPGKQTDIEITLTRDPKVQFSATPAEIKLKITPERAAVFVDGEFAGTVNQFSGVGRAMLVSPGNHHIKIDLAGFRPFETDVTLAPKQKISIKADLVQGSILQADPAIKKN